MKGTVEQVGTPEDVYSNPHSEFVANFIGRCSIIEGVVADGVFRSPSGISLTSAAPPGPCKVAIRPEAITVREPGEGSIAATIATASFAGAVMHLGVSVADDKLLVDHAFARDMRPTAGDPIHIAINAEAVRFLSK